MADQINSKYLNWIYRIILLLLVLILFFFSIELMVQSTSTITNQLFRDLISATHDPFISFFIGLLSTAILQSSSTITSIAVATVAAGAIPFSSGIYIIVGANIGTTLTSNIVSLAFISKKEEFKRALATATVHDLFNILTALIILPMEYYFHFLSNSALFFTSLITHDHPSQYEIIYESRFIFTPLARIFITWFGNWIPLVLGVLLLFLSIHYMTQIIYIILIGKSRAKFRLFIFENQYRSFGWGLLLTSAIQSSSITTSLVVPLAAADKIKLNWAFPFIIGANVGTTVTALLASVFKPDAAISIAIAHSLFNIFGALLFLPLNSLRKVPVYIADHFSSLASEKRILFFIYVLLTFFLIPFGLIYLGK